MLSSSSLCFCYNCVSVRVGATAVCKGASPTSLYFRLHAQPSSIVTLCGLPQLVYGIFIVTLMMKMASPMGLASTLSLALSVYSLYFV